MKRSYNEREKNAGEYSHKRRKVTSLNVWPRNQFERSFPKFSPKEVGKFSLDARRDFFHDASQLKFFVQPSSCQSDDGSLEATDKAKGTLSLNLREGYDIFIQKDENIKEHLDDLLRWILLNRESFDLKSKDRIPMEFVCWRGLLTKILCTPYENREGWKLAAARYKNCIYLCEYDTQQKVEDRRREEPRQKEMTYWGLKFEQYVTADTENGLPDTKKPVNSNEAYVSVVRSNLNNHELVFGGEVDCREGSEYVELKTSRLMVAPNHFNNFKRFKLIKWWAQSFLIGIQKVICGFRDDDGIVKSLETFKTNEIPKYCKDINQCWKGTVCFNFCDEFLKFIKDTVEVDYDKGIYVFEWMPRQPVSSSIHKPDSEYAFLPRWFTDSFESTGTSTDKATTKDLPKTILKADPPKDEPNNDAISAHEEHLNATDVKAGKIMKLDREQQ